MYGTVLIVPEPAALRHMLSAGDDSFTVLVDSGASSHFFDDLIIPSLKHRMLNYVFSSHYATQNSHCRRALLDGTGEGIQQGLVTET